ncbi:hypothetical protein RND81_06G209700 [Saponaria officinalis]|uniref:G-patch domain-containing protein n=1 Tax=Saponaria officinalis TaxID=3572 RepID=A0AAW1KDW7_SAPOF
MKLQSFALQSKASSSSSSKPKFPKKFADDESSSQNQPPKNPEFVSEFDPSKTLDSSSKRTIIIPPKENEWRPHKKMKNLELPPLHSGNKPLDFELENSDDVASKDSSGGSMSYGLNLRQTNGKIDDYVVNNGANDSSSIDNLMIRQFKSDLETLPEEQGFDEYEDTPVDGFGAALLAGYGWKEGRGIGKNARDDVKVVEYKRRTAKEGLGFMADTPPSSKVVSDVKIVKEKENVGRIEGKSDGFGVGRGVRVVRGSKMGLKGVVVKVLEDGMVVLDDEVGGRDSFRVDELAELGSSEEENCLKKLKELKIRESRDDRRNDRKKSKDDERSVKRESKRSREYVGDGIKPERVHRDEKSGSSRKRVMWLMSHIKVRVISKELKGGRYYLKKGEVVDVIGPGICDISMDEGKEIVRGVDQDILETALPRRGGFVIVLLGKHKGVYGKLVEKDSEKETGIVQDADTLEMFDVRLEQIAEYLGDPSYLGY